MFVFSTIFNERFLSVDKVTNLWVPMLHFHIIVIKWTHNYAVYCICFSEERYLSRKKNHSSNRNLNENILCPKYSFWNENIFQMHSRHLWIWHLRSIINYFNKCSPNKLCHEYETGCWQETAAIFRSSLKYTKNDF